MRRNRPLTPARKQDYRWTGALLLIYFGGGLLLAAVTWSASHPLIAIPLLLAGAWAVKTVREGQPCNPEAKKGASKQPDLRVAEDSVITALMAKGLTEAKATKLAKATPWLYKLNEADLQSLQLGETH